MNRRQHLKRWFFATAAVALIGVSALSDRGVSAQEATPTPTGAGASTVTVNGTGSVTVTPDEASISVGVNVVNASLAEAQSQATTQMNQVIDALKAAGIAELDIQTSNYSVNVIQEYDTNGYPARVSGYQVNNQVNVKVRDISKLGDILEAAVAAGANSIYGVGFVVSDPADAAKQARTDAVADATRKAQEIADATGMSLGRVVSVTETSGPTPMPKQYGGMEMAADMASVPIQQGGNIIAVDVQMTFELVP
jgi:uncharacterized protein YggE